MAVFVWQGIDSRGKSTKGVRDAENARALRMGLRKEGILVTSIEEEHVARSRTRREIDFRRLFQRTSVLDVALATRQLATLLKSGVPLVQALTALIEQVDNPPLQNAMTQVRDRVNEGSSLADALKGHPQIFESLYVNMVAAGEASGTLDLVLDRLASFLDSQSQLKTKVSSALAYPAFMLLIGVLVIWIMMVVVVPKVTAIFENFNQVLPWYTRVLIFFSELFSGWWWLILGLVALGLYLLQRWRSTTEGRTKWDIKMLELPLFGKLMLMVAVARFARTLGTLLSSGVPLLTALDITKNVLGNVELMRVVEEARVSIREGESIAAPLKRSGRFPPIVTHMIAIGERSGELEQMLEHVANAYDNQVEARITWMTSLLEPLMIVVMGGGAAFIAFAILMPLLQINEFI